MHRKLILTALASAAILCGGQALAAGGPGGGGGGPGGGGHGGGGDHGGMGDHGGGGGGMGPGGPAGTGMGPGSPGGMGRGDIGDMDRGDGRINSQGPDHASPTGIAHANENSVLAGTTAADRVSSGALSGVTDGMAVFFNGTQVGTVQQIRLAGNGNVALVLVKATNGAIFPVPANKLNLTNGTLSTTARFRGLNDRDMAQAGMDRDRDRGTEAEARDANDNDAARMNRDRDNEAENEANDVNDNDAMRGRMNSQGLAHASATGIAHANSHSVLAGGSTSTLSGVSVGMPLFQNGVQVGTVSRVITENGMIRRVFVQGTNGRTFSLSPSSLTASNGALTTTARLRGM